MYVLKIERGDIMAEAHVKKLICGIQFNHSFSLLDNWGKIADTILYKKNEYFDSTYFPNISDHYTINRHIENPQKGHRLQLNSENMVYTHVIQENYEKEFDTFTESIINYLYPKIVDDYDLVVRRLGIVFVSQMDQVAINSFTSQYFKPELSEVIDCRFSKRASAPQGLLFSETNDYINKIYSVSNIGQNVQGISFDYQLFFNPPQPDVKSRMRKFFDEAQKTFSEEVYKEDFRGKQ